MFGIEFPETLGRAGHDERRCQVFKLGGKQFFVAVPQSGRRIDHQSALLLRRFQYIGGHQEFPVHRWVLPHQNHVEVTQRTILTGAEAVPVVRIHVHSQPTGVSPGLAARKIEIRQFHVLDFPAAFLGGMQHGQRTVFLEVNILNGIHHDPQPDCHSVSWNCR